MNRDRDNVPRWLNQLLIFVTIVTTVVAAIATASIVRADELPPGYVEPPGPCILDVESGLWLAPGPVPCGPTLAAWAAENPGDPIDETGCTPAAASDNCPGDQPTPAQAQTYGDCEGPDGYCTTEPPTTTAPATTAPPATTNPPADTTTTTEPATTTTAPPTTTTATPTTTTTVAVGPPPVPSTTAAPCVPPNDGRTYLPDCTPEPCVITIDGTDYESTTWTPGHVVGGDHGATSPSLMHCTVPTTTPPPTVTPNLPNTGNTAALWQLAAGAFAMALGTVLVLAARQRT